MEVTLKDISEFLFYNPSDTRLFSFNFTDEYTLVISGIDDRTSKILPPQETGIYVDLKRTYVFDILNINTKMVKSIMINSRHLTDRQLVCRWDEFKNTFTISSKFVDNELIDFTDLLDRDTIKIAFGSQGSRWDVIKFKPYSVNFEMRFEPESVYFKLVREMEREYGDAFSKSRDGLIVNLSNLRSPPVDVSNRDTIVLNEDEFIIKSFRLRPLRIHYFYKFSRLLPTSYTPKLRVYPNFVANISPTFVNFELMNIEFEKSSYQKHYKHVNYRIEEV